MQVMMNLSLFFCEVVDLSPVVVPGVEFYFLELIS